jgi:ribosome biogenesis GTPase / thiamine phosphate phosphatase
LSAASRGAAASSRLALARVVGVHGRHSVIETADGTRMLAHGRGKKSEVIVGDRVRWQVSGDEAVIESFEPRASLLKRQDEWRSKNFAANIDLLLIMVATDPPYSESQLARALIAAEDGRIAVKIVLNKVDLPEAAAARERLAPYRRMGYEVLEVAVKADPAGTQALFGPLLKDKTTLVLGPSGMGKSTLVNLLVPHADAQVGEISKALKSGKHTTTTTTWYWLDDARHSALIDSPGFQEFGIHHIQASELGSLMLDYGMYLGDCKFANCTHRHEPACGVRAAIARGDISPSRERIYEELMDVLARAASRH